MVLSVRGIANDRESLASTEHAVGLILNQPRRKRGSEHAGDRESKFVDIGE